MPVSIDRRGALSLVLCMFAVGCSSASATKSVDGYETSALRYEGTAGYVSAAELAEDLGFLAPIKLDYVGNNSTGGPHSIAAVVSGDLDIGSSFNGAIIKLVAAKAPVRAVAAGYGSDAKNFQGFYVLDDSPLRTARDLIGKKISVNTLGAHVEFVLKEFLMRGGLSDAQIRDVTMVVTPSVNGELALRERHVDLAALGLVFRIKAVERGGVRALFSDTEMFGEFTAGSYMMSEKFIAAHPKTTQKFVDAVRQAIDWSRARPEQEVVARMQAIVKKRKRNEDDTPVKSWRSFGVATPGARLTERDFQMWIDWLERDGQIERGRVRARDVYRADLQR